MRAPAVALADSAACVQAFRVGAATWGIQFHAEVTLEDLLAWVDHERSPEEVERLRLDAEAQRAQTARRIVKRWNALGRELGARFLEAATA